MLPTGRLSGILLPVFSLRSANDFGIGDFGALDGLFAWMQRARQKMVMLLPLLPTAPNDSSPYATRAAVGLNPLFIDLAGMPEFAEAGGFGALTADERAKLDEARSSARIRYELVFPLKGAALRRSFERFYEKHWKADDARAAELWAYLEAQKDWLSDYALFAAVSQEQLYKPWWEWPEPLRLRRKEALDEARQRLEHEVLFHSWLQWVAERQWVRVRAQARARGVLLCGDEPFIIGQDSVDAWVYPHLLRRDARLGVPPDDFSATGQDWGLPYFDFEAMEREDYRWLRFRARKAASYYDLRRVDHAVGYFRQWIRDEKTPTGRFIPAEEERQKRLGEKHFKLLSEGAGIVAEDLGVIPDWVRETLTKLGLPGYRVLRWERKDGVYRNPHEFPPLSLATTGTHDTDTMREWWEKAPDWERTAVFNAWPELKELGQVPSEWTPELHRALIRCAMKSASNLCVIPWQDALGTRERINLPGSMTDANWAYRIAQNVDALLEDAETKRAAELMAELTAESGRA